MTNALKIAPPPPRPSAKQPVIQAEQEQEPGGPRPATAPPSAAKPVSRSVTATKFRQLKEDERVQFNKRVTRRVADGFEMLAIRSRKRVPELLAEALELLEQRYGRIG
jgi:hypothetical protein